MLLFTLSKYLSSRKSSKKVNNKNDKNNTAKMNIPSVNPHLDINDQSQVDESITQSDSPIYNTGTINQNCGNQREMSRFTSTMLGIIVSIICDALIIFGIFYGFQSMSDNFSTKLEKMDVIATMTHNDIRRESKEEVNTFITETKNEMTKIIKEARTSNIWMIRHDILKTIDHHTAMKVITTEQYDYLKEEFEHYKEIGGNHDVAAKFNLFTAKIFGTGEIKMIATQSK